MEELRDFIWGTFIFVFVATMLYSVNYNLFPSNHWSWLECWGIVMMGIMFKSGVDIWNDIDNEE